MKSFSGLLLRTGFLSGVPFYRVLESLARSEGWCFLCGNLDLGSGLRINACSRLSFPDPEGAGELTLISRRLQKPALLHHGLESHFCFFLGDVGFFRYVRDEFSLRVMVIPSLMIGTVQNIASRGSAFAISIPESIVN